MNTKYLRFPDLQGQGIVNNRMTLSRWIRLHGFPKGILLGPNTRVWSADEVDTWIKYREEQNNEE
jgi:predicted DNA-binding transcriptional regulator AlpA